MEALSVDGIPLRISGYLDKEDLLAVVTVFRSCASLLERFTTWRSHMRPVLCVCGGMEDDMLLSRVDLFDPVTAGWESLPRMISTRFGFASTVLGGRLFICRGGGPK